MRPSHTFRERLKGDPDNPQFHFTLGQALVEEGDFEQALVPLTYCLEVNAKGGLVGEGERNAEGKPEGRGTMVYASGNMYEGQWLAGKQSGEGR